MVNPVTTGSRSTPTPRPAIEGFVPDASLERIQRLVRIGIDLSARHSASTRTELRAEWREVRSSGGGGKPNRLELKQEVERAVTQAADWTHRARSLAAEGKIKEATELIERAVTEIGEGSEVNERLLTERSMLQILAAVDLHMSAFLHDINA